MTTSANSKNSDTSAKSDTNLLMDTSLITLDFVSVHVPVAWQKMGTKRQGGDRVWWAQRQARRKSGFFYSGKLEVRARRYKWGQAPKVTAHTLLQEVSAYVQRHLHGWGTLHSAAYDQSTSEQSTQNGPPVSPLTMAAASFEACDDIAEVWMLLRAWVVSDGRHFAYLLYESDALDEEGELRSMRKKEMQECQAVAESVAFRK